MSKGCFFSLSINHLEESFSESEVQGLLVLQTAEKIVESCKRFSRLVRKRAPRMGLARC